MISATFNDLPYASASCGSRIVELYNELFSSNKIVVGESIMVVGELASHSSSELEVVFVPVVDTKRVIALTGSKVECSPGPLLPSHAGEIAASEWQVMNASFSTEPGTRIKLEPGVTVPFSIEIKSAEPGTFHLRTGYIIFYNGLDGKENSIIHLARGQTVQVLPTQTQVKECQELGIPSDKCSDIAILQGRELEIRDRIITQEQLEQLDTAMYMIGIGAAIAGIMSFVTLRKRI
jgi:hypothetical protein